MSLRPPSSREALDQDGQPDGRPVLVFVGQSTSGPSRRMSGLVAWLKITRRSRLRVTELDLDRHRALARSLRVHTAPTLVLVEGGEERARLEGRATGRQIDEMIAPWVSDGLNDAEPGDGGQQPVENAP